MSASRWALLLAPVAAVAWMGCSSHAAGPPVERLVDGAPLAPAATQLAGAPTTTSTTAPPGPVVVEPSRPADRPQDAARRFVSEYYAYSWRDPPGSGARRAAVYATTAFARELLRATRPFAGWSAVVERQEEAIAVIEAAYRDGEHGEDVVVTVLVRIEARSKVGTRTSRQAVGVHVEATSGGWLVGGIDP